MIFGEDTKVGDRVLVKNYHGWRADTILKVTPTQVVISHDRFVRKTGLRFGDRHYQSSRTVAEPLTPEAQARWDRRVAARAAQDRINAVAKRLQALRVDDENVTAIELFLDTLKEKTTCG